MHIVLDLMLYNGTPILAGIASVVLWGRATVCIQMRFLYSCSIDVDGSRYDQ